MRFDSGLCQEKFKTTHTKNVMKCPFGCFVVIYGYLWLFMVIYGGHVLPEIFNVRMHV